MKRIILVHGWRSGPDKNWFPWLREELEGHGYEVLAPQLPDPEEPQIETWVPALHEAAGVPDTDTFFVAHSIGCQTTLRYLAGLPDGPVAGGAVFVAGFVTPLAGEGSDGRSRAEVWADTPLNDNEVRAHLNASVAIFSDNDRLVPLDNAEAFKSRFGSEIVIEHAKGHFTKETNPEALEAVLGLVS